MLGGNPTLYFPIFVVLFLGFFNLDCLVLVLVLVISLAFNS